MMATTFNGNPNTTIISCYYLPNFSDETDLITFYKELFSLIRSIPKHNILVIGRDTNTQLVKQKWGVPNISHLKMDYHVLMF